MKQPQTFSPTTPLTPSARSPSSSSSRPTISEAAELPDARNNIFPSSSHDRTPVGTLAHRHHDAPLPGAEHSSNPGPGIMSWSIPTTCTSSLDMDIRRPLPGNENPGAASLSQPSPPALIEEQQAEEERTSSHDPTWYRCTGRAGTKACDSIKRQLKLNGAEAIQGEFGIGLQQGVFMMPFTGRYHEAAAEEYDWFDKQGEIKEEGSTEAEDGPDTPQKQFFEYAGPLHSVRILPASCVLAVGTSRKFHALARESLMTWRSTGA